MGTRVNSSSINANSTGATSYTVALGVAVQTGDVIVIAGASQGTHATNGMSASMTATSEAFTTIKEQQGGNASSRWLQTFIYVATQAFASTDTITFTPYAASTQNSFSVDIFRGYTSTVDQSVQGQSNSSGTNTAPALLGNATANALVLTFIQTSTGTLTAGTPFSTGSTNTTTQDTGIGYVLAASGSSTYGSTWSLGTAGTNATETVSYLAAATDIPYSPPRTIPSRDYGEAWWIQRDRRDANTVATAANPLPAPLDSAWQAGGHYQHLYTQAADITSRAWWPQQRAYVSPAGLLDTALLENELLGGADTGKRYGLPATHVDRRLVPQQRAYVSDPGLLATALLEGVLLGGGDTSRHYLTPATHVARWWMPQQPKRDAYSPGLLDTALLENELLGSADDLRRRYLQPATHADRREVPQQPNRWTLYFDAGPDVPPLTLSWGADGRYSVLYNQAGWQPDRREVPQQRPYISDPSFYPTVAPTDPLTVAWGAGGHYWLLYNQAGLYTDRRLVPQQRPYISDPGLLATALLENELLGGADDLRRRYVLWAYDRHQTGGYQPRSPVPTDLPADPLLVGGGVGGDRWRRYLQPATHVDRRQTVRERDRWTLYFSINVPGSMTSSTRAATVGSATASSRLTSSTSGGDA